MKNAVQGFSFLAFFLLPSLVQSRVLSQGLVETSKDKATILVSGSHWIEREPQRQIRFIHGQFTCSGACLVDSTDLWKVKFYSVLGTHKIYLRSGQVFEVPEGFKVVLGPLDSSGMQSLSMIEPWRPTEVAVLRNKVSRLDANEVKPFLDRIRRSHQRALGETRVLYERIAEYQRARLDEEKDLVEKSRRSQLEKARVRKQQYFERTFNR